MSTLAQQARAERKRRGLTQPQAAKLVGISPRAYQDFEGGKTKTQPANLSQIIEKLGLHPEDAERAQITRDEFPVETRVFLDMLGAYMETMTTEQRLEFIGEETRRLLHRPR